MTNIAVGVGVVGLVILLAVVAIRIHLSSKKTKRPNRKQSAEVKQAQKAYEAKRDREWALQGFSYKAFKDGMDAMVETAKINNWSVFKFVKEALERTEEALLEYRNACTKPHLVDACMPNYYSVCMKHAVDAIVLFSGRKNLSGVGMELMSFVELHFRLKNIHSVFYRHRQHLHYSERCEAMSVAILSFFGQSISKTAMDYATKPFDYLTDEDMVEWDLVQKEFFRKAVDEYFADAVKGIERENYSAQARRDNHEHQKNRRQRSARMKKQTKKARKMNYA